MFNDWQQALAAEELPLEATPEDELAAAARLTARNSRDKDDLALLLAAVGVPTDIDTITALLPLIPDPADTDDDPADTTGTTGDDSDMTTTAPEQAKATPTAEEAMAVSMFFATRPIGDISEITGLSEQRIRHLADAAEAEADALQMAVEGRAPAAIAAAVDLPEPKVTDLIDAAPITSAAPQTPAGTTTGAPAAADRDLVDAGTIGVMLAWAEKHDLASIRSRAARIRTDLAELSDRRSTEQATAQAEARVAELKAQLEAAQADLRAVKSGTARTVPAPDVVPVPAPVAPAADGKRSREDLAAIRTWARENGFKVGVAGIIKASIVDAYDAAHQPAPLAKVG